MLGGIIVAFVIAVFLWQTKHRTGSTGAAGLNSIAVLPLQNLNGDFSVDYLRFALADEIANVLTYSRTLDVRPSAVTRKYVNADLDPQQVGQELHVATVLTGHFLKQENHLLVTLEAIETGNDRMMWQTNLNGSTQDLISLQQQLAKQVRQGLLPIWALRAASWKPAPGRAIRKPTIFICAAWLRLTIQLPIGKQSRSLEQCSGTGSELRSGLGGVGPALLLRRHLLERWRADVPALECSLGTRAGS